MHTGPAELLFSTVLVPGRACGPGLEEVGPAITLHSAANMSGGGVSVNRDSLVQRLQTLNITQQSIEGTAKWCLFYIKDAKTVVNIWLEEFGRVTTERRIAFLYLANHILQVGAGRRGLLLGVSAGEGGNDGWGARLGAAEVNHQAGCMGGRCRLRVHGLRTNSAAWGGAPRASPRAQARHIR